MTTPVDSIGSFQRFYFHTSLIENGIAIIKNPMQNMSYSTYVLECHLNFAVRKFRTSSNNKKLLS